MSSPLPTGVIRPRSWHDVHVVIVKRDRGICCYIPLILHPHMLIMPIVATTSASPRFHFRPTPDPTTPVFPRSYPMCSCSPKPHILLKFRPQVSPLASMNIGGYTEIWEACCSGLAPKSSPAYSLSHDNDSSWAFTARHPCVGRG